MNRESEGKSSGIPHLAKNKRDMGHPSLMREQEAMRLVRHDHGLRFKINRNRYSFISGKFYSRGTSPGIYSYSRTTRGRGRRNRSLSAEDKADRGAQRVLIAGGGQQPRAGIAGKNDDIGGVLVGHQQPLIAGIK